jgi:hypothetical protein
VAIATDIENGPRSQIGDIGEQLVENPIKRFSAEELEEIGRLFDQVHDEVFNDLGERDAKSIRSMIEFHRRLVVIGRILLFGSKHKPLWASGTCSRSTTSC